MVSAKHIAIVLVTLSTHVLAQALSPIDRTADRSEIMRSIAEISEAYVARNPEPFERIYLENYVKIGDKPVYNWREQLIAMIRADSGPVKAGKKLDYETLSFESENPQIHFYGQTAIVNIVKKNFWQYRGRKCLTKTQETELWLKREGRWQLAAGQTTTFQCDAKPMYDVHPAVAAIPALTKPAANLDRDAESQIRSVLNEVAAARTLGADNFAVALEKNTIKDFVATDSKGDVVGDRTLLSSLTLQKPSRIGGLRNQDDAIVVYDNAALYTYRAKGATSATATPEPPQQCSIILVNVDGKWLIAATHITRLL